MDVLTEDVVGFGGGEMVESLQAAIDPAVVAQILGLPDRLAERAVGSSPVRR
jgi:hypothetical protein